MTDKLETGLRYGHFPLRVALPRYGQGQGHKDKRRSEEARARLTVNNSRNLRSSVLPLFCSGQAVEKRTSSAFFVVV